MFTKSAHLYDAIYSFIDYESESQTIHDLIEHYKRSSGKELLDVACGTGQHISFLRRHYCVEGLDIQPEMLTIAGERNPGIEFHLADMLEFDLSKQFDAIICMFSSIGFVKTEENMRTAVANFAGHLKPGGVVIIEPWVLKEKFIDGHLGAAYIDRADLKATRINTSKLIGDVSVLDMHYLVGTSNGIEHYSERHELGVFTNEQYMNALTGAGLEAFFQTDGPKKKELYNRGLYIGIKSQ